MNLTFVFAFLYILACEPNIISGEACGLTNIKEESLSRFAYLQPYSRLNNRDQPSPLLKNNGVRLSANRSQGFGAVGRFSTEGCSNSGRPCRSSFAIPWRSWAPLTPSLDESDDLGLDKNGGGGGSLGDNKLPYDGPPGSFVGNMGPMWDLISPRYAEANARFLRLSPIKVNRTIFEIRGMSIVKALAHLATSPRRPAYCVFRCIESALYNAKNLYKGGPDLKPKLISVTANRGPVFKRPFFRAKGKMDIRRRPTTHIKVIVQV